MEINTLWDFFIYIKNKISSYRKIIIIIFISLCIHALFDILTPIITMKFIDNLQFYMSKEFNIVISSFIFIIPLVSGLLMVFEDYNANIVAHKTLTKIRLSFFDKYLKQKYEVMKSTDTGDYLTRIIEEPEEIGDFIYYTGLQIILNICRIVIILSIIFFIDNKLSMILIVILFLYLLPFSIVSNKLKIYSKNQVELNSCSVDFLNQCLNFFYVSKVFNLEYNLYEKYVSINSKYATKYVSLKLFEKLNTLIIGIIKNFGISIIYLYCGYKVICGEMTVGMLIGIKLYIDEILEYSKSLYERIIQTLVKIPYANRINRIENNPLSLEISGNEHLDHVDSLIFKDIVFNYNDKLVFDRFDLDINTKEHTILVGNSGCGKTTLLNLLIRLYDVRSGEILLNHKNIKDYSLEDLRSKIVICSQNPDIITDTIWNNISFGISDINEQLAFGIIKDLKMDTFINKLPLKYDTIIGGDGASHLSGGQIQKISLCRAILQQPEVLLLDEITSALDHESITCVINVLKKYMKGKTIISTTHNINIAEISDSIIFFGPNNNLIFSKHSELIKNNEDYRKHFKISNYK